MSQTIRNGQSIRVNIQTGEKLSAVAVTGTYSITVLAGTGTGTSLATSATGGTYGPYAYPLVVQIVASAASEIDYDAGVTTSIESDTVAYLKTDPLTGGVTGLVGPNGFVGLGNSFLNANALSLKKWRAALSKQQQGQVAAKILCLGDSTDVGLYASGSQFAGNFAQAFPQSLATLLNQRGLTVNTASRFADGNVQVANLASYDSRVTVPAGWVNGNPTLAGTLLQNTTTANVLSFLPSGSFQFNSIDVYYVKAAGYDAFAVNVDGGATLATATQSGAVSIGKITVACTLGSHTVNIVKAGAGGTCQIIGIDCYNTTAPAIQIYNAGYSGAKAANIDSTTAAYSSGYMIGSIAPDLTIFNCTINDTGANSGGTITDLTAYAASLQAIITKCRASGDVIARLANPFTGTGSANYYAVRAAFIAVMQLNSVPLADGYGRWVSWSDANSLGFISDAVHPNRYGYQDYANFVVAMIAP